MPKYRISYSFENIVEADDIDEARQFLIDDVIFDMEHGYDVIDVEEIEEETTDEISYIPFKPGDVKCTCNDCPINDTCMYAWDSYNEDGDCLLDK